VAPRGGTALVICAHQLERARERARDIMEWRQSIGAKAAAADRSRAPHTLPTCISHLSLCAKN